MASDLNQVLADGNYGHVSFYNGIKIQEIRGRTGSDTGGAAIASRTFLISGTTDPLAAHAALEHGPVPINLYAGLGLVSIDHEAVGFDQWEFTCSYDSITPSVGSYSISIDTTGGAILQTYGYAQTSYNATGETAVDYGKAIDVQDGKPQGVQRVIPALKINVRAKIATQYLGSPIAYAKTIAGLTGFTNSAAMFGGEFAAEELLFIGATGEVVAKNPQLVFSFLASPNITGLTIGDITGISKKGHEYLWFDFKRAKDATANMPTREIRAAYVGQIYTTADMSALNIGSPPS